MKRMILGAVALSAICGSADAKGGHAYWQGVCDGLRASGKYDASAKLAVVVTEDNGKITARPGQYFGCNGVGFADITDTIADQTIFVRHHKE